MSVPLPTSPAGLPTSSAKPITPSRSVPMPISLNITPSASSPSSLGHSPGRPERERGRRGSRTGGASGGKVSAQSPGNESNWRERVVPGSGGVIAGMPSGAGKSKGPERTVGGFAKKDQGGPATTQIAGTSGVNAIAGGDARKDKDKASADKAASLAHVPCRFYKAGSCTAGDSCPFSHEGSSKREVCQWFLKGNCKFGHKCALAHIRPGETMAMDRKNKKAAQLEGKSDKPSPPGSSPGQAPTPPAEESHTTASSPSVPIRSAISSSFQTAPLPVSAGSGSRLSSSPMREPYGPPSGAGIGSSPSTGFLGRSPGAFGASPNRPSPLSSSFSARLAGPSSLALKGTPTTATTAIQPRPAPATAGPTAGFSSSFSHSSLAPEKPPSRPPLSASMADGSYLRRSIWAHSSTPDEALSPRRPIGPQPSKSRPDVFHDDDDDDHGEDLLPSSLSELLTPIERARRMSRRDSNDYFGASPSRTQLSPGHGAMWTGERLAQSAGASMGPMGPIQSIWSPGALDGRQGNGSNSATDFTFGPSTAAPATAPRQSLLSQQRAPASPLRYHARVRQPTGSDSASAANGGWSDVVSTGEGEIDRTSLAPPYFNRATDPSSPSAKALSAHAPGQSLPGGVATALSRLHFQADPALNSSSSAQPSDSVPYKQQGGRHVIDHASDLTKRDEGEEEMFAMDG